MNDCARTKSVLYECNESKEYKDMFVAEGEPLNIEGCGSPMLATLFFISFMVIVSFIFLNLFIAIILESFESSQDDEGRKVGESTITIFNDFWSQD